MNLVTRVLGLVHRSEVKDFSIDNMHSKHIDKRKGRYNLILEDAKPLYYFETFRVTDYSRQVHCLLEDATLLIFNKETKMLITIIIPDEDLLNLYLNSTDGIGKNTELSLYKCAKLNVKSGATKIDNNLENFDLKDYKERKRKYIMSWYYSLYTFSSRRMSNYEIPHQ